MAIMHSKLCTLVRQDTSQSWGFRMQGGSDYGLPLTVHKVGEGSISECRGLQTGDTILQIGRERTIDMKHQDAQDAVLRAGNRLDLVVLRSVGEVIDTKKEPARISALVHNTYNSPMGLYSTENITNQLITQAQVLTKGTAVGASILKKSPDMNSQTTTTVKRSEVYRMVHEEEEGKLSESPKSPGSFYRDTVASPTSQSQSFLKLERTLHHPYGHKETSTEEEEESSSASPSPTNMRRAGPAPAAPPKPSVGWRDQGQGSPSPQGHRQPQTQGPPSPQGYRQPQPQQHQPRPQPQPQPQPQQRPQYQPQVQQQQRPQYQAQPQYQPQPQQQPQQQRPQYQPQQRPQYQPQYVAPPQQDQNLYNASFEIKSTPTQNGTGGPYRGGPGATFQSVIPVQSSSSPHTIVNEVTWSPSQERGLPVWPPQKNDVPIPTSSQSFKFAGGAGPSKKFIWPPPKDYVEIMEEYEGDQRRTIYHHVKDPKPNPARVYVSPRSPARLTDNTKEPYSKEYREVIPPKRGYIGKNLRNFNDIFESNSTRLPPTYRAPPGTHYVPC